ncbi:DUF481 domain-containing protein [Flavobacterium sp. A45]|uniref:DUF481 domain-containing protein n=1 Tax=Flavobacterium sp. A45 TaxID=1945862 RepID=UPI0009863655|nr:DUF481 domain-containing protein [Flavobacterium sp. A45]OOG63780.1 hypothetical protein B0E44_17365 [Flavobacterium sp. A45]
MKCFLLSLFSLFYIGLYGQKDTLYFKNKEMMVGEVKSMSNNILIAETKYSDQDFKIEFDKVVKLILVNKYSIYLVDGSSFYGTLKSNKDNEVTITYGDTIQDVSVNKIVSLNKIESGFWKHFTGSFDFGYNFAKTNNSEQLTFALQLNYISEKWIHTIKYDELQTVQDDVEDIERVDWELDTKKYYRNNWFFNSNFSFLSNTSQSIKGRFSPSFGMGNYLVRNNKLYFLAGAGLTYNIEKYFDSTNDKNSFELVLNTQLNMFNFKDININTSVLMFPSLSEKGRFRTDIDFSFKYDLPLDFYIKSSISVNYDNQPFQDTEKLDYVFSTGFGWKLKH